MAAFNPQVPDTNPPSFIGYSKPIQGYSGNKAGETLLKGLGSDLDEGVKDINEGVKQNIASQEDAGLQSLRDGYRNRLQSTYNDLSGQPLDILPKDSTDNGAPPPDLSQRIAGRLDTLDAARKSGKYSDTHLDMEYDDFLKEMRSKYPGYRDWIDQTASRSLGRGEPANRVIAQLTGDINSYAAQAQKRRNDIDTKLGQVAASGDPEATAAYKNRNNLSEGEKTDLLNRKAVQSSRIAQIKQTRDQSNTDPGLRTSAAFAEANQRVSDSMSNFVHTFTAGGATTEQLISEIENNKSTTEQKAQAMGLLSNAMQVFRQRQVAEFNKVDPKTGRSLDQDLGGKSQEIIDKQIAFYNSFKSWMQNGNSGPVAATVNYVKAMDKDPMASLMKGSVDQYIGTMNKIMKDNPNANGYLKSVQLDNNNINPSIKAAADSRRFALASGSPGSINQTIQNAKNESLPEKVGDANARGFFSNVVGWYHDLFNKDNPSVQRNMAMAMFGPGNAGVMRNFPVDSATTKGQSTVFNQWFSPAVDKVMFTDVGKKDGNLLSSYTELKKNEFGKTVLPNEIASLNNYSGDAKYSYDNETHMLGLHGDVDPATRIAVNRLNTGLASISSLAKFTREDPNQMVLQWIHESDIGDGPASKAIKRAVKSAFLSPKKDEKEAA